MTKCPFPAFYDIPAPSRQEYGSGQRPLRSDHYLRFSQDWFPTVQEVLHADWQDVWHSPQPPFFMDSFSVLEVNVFTRFTLSSSYPAPLRGIFKIV